MKAIAPQQKSMLPTDQEVQVNISELTLTPFTGASLVNEILKGLIYQKCQIPYPYSWLKTVVEKRRNKLNSEVCPFPKKLNFKHENHFRIVSATYDTVDAIMKGITKEFCETNNVIKEVIVVFGATPACPKEVFTIALPSTVRGHIERNHVGLLNKHLPKVLRNIFLSQAWLDSIDASITCSNTYIYLKKQDGAESIAIDGAFELCGPLQISSHIKHSKFIISQNTSERTNCCASLVIFNENGEHRKQKNEEPSLDAEENVIWCRSKEIVKGFKDCFIDKVSVCEMW